MSRSVYSYVPKSRYHAILWRRCCILSTKNLHRVMLAPWKTTAPIDVRTCMHVGWNINSRSLLLVGRHDPLYKGDKPLCGLADGHDCAILNIMPSHEPNCWRRGGGRGGGYNIIIHRTGRSDRSRRLFAYPFSRNCFGIYIQTPLFRSLFTSYHLLIIQL